ncbi:hypothetical protein PR048_004149 [Dryococelus australis]|uniref:Uncharacterized protein n=1 Tax=Dryococelus australis TaxID=614101 RepID=A0ABQ9I5I2_9NEOP|nr:hypothetical protein PR048_004149 [Dryococelus australis]
MAWSGDAEGAVVSHQRRLLSLDFMLSAAGFLRSGSALPTPLPAFTAFPSRRAVLARSRIGFLLLLKGLLNTHSTLLLPVYYRLAVKRGVSKQLSSNHNKCLKSTSPSNELAKYSWLYLLSTALDYDEREEKRAARAVTSGRNIRDCEHQRNFERKNSSSEQASYSRMSRKIFTLRTADGIRNLPHIVQKSAVMDSTVNNSGKRGKEPQTENGSGTVGLGIIDIRGPGFFVLQYQKSSGNHENSTEVAKRGFLVKVKQGGYGAARGNGRSPRKPADERLRPARIPCTKIPGANPPGVEPGRRWRESSTLAADSPRPLCSVLGIADMKMCGQVVRAIRSGALVAQSIERFQVRPQASQKQSSDTLKTPYGRVKRCRERKINIKAFERVNVRLIQHAKQTAVSPTKNTPSACEHTSSCSLSALSDELKQPESVFSDVTMTSREHERALSGPTETRPWEKISGRTLMSSSGDSFLTVTALGGCEPAAGGVDRLPMSPRHLSNAAGVCTLLTDFTFRDGSLAPPRRNNGQTKTQRTVTFASQLDGRPTTTEIGNPPAP